MQSVKGTILGFDSSTKTGVLKCESGNRFSFEVADWKGKALPKTGTYVDFIPKDNVAHEIYEQIQNNTKVINHNTTTSTLAVISLVCGIVGLFFFGSIIAIVCGHIASYKIKHSNGQLSGRGMAIAGTTLGYIGLILGLIGYLILGSFFLSL